MNFISNLNIGRRLAVAFAVMIVALVAVGSTALYTSSKLAEADRWNSHTYKVLGTAAGMLENMINMETGARGFFVAGEDRFLEPWKNGQAAFDKHFAAARELTADNEAQQKRLSEIGARKAEFAQVAQSMIAMRQEVRSGAKSMENFVAEFGKGLDKAAMDGFAACRRSSTRPSATCW